MMPSLKKIVFHNTPLKVLSLTLGYLFWYACGAIHTVSSWVTIPVCFYNVPKHARLIAPESIQIQLRARRSELRTLDIEKLAIHVDAKNLETGKNLLIVSSDTLLLPETIKLVHYAPTNPCIEYHPDSET